MSDEESKPAAGLWVSRSAYDEAINAIMEGDKRLEAAEKMVSQMLGALADIADSEDEYGVPSSREWMEKRAKEAFSLSAPVDGRWCQASERDAAIRERDAAEEGATAAIQMRNHALARAHAAEALARESGRQVVDGISAMLTIANQRDAAIARAEKAEAQLLSAAQALYGKIDGTRLVPDMSLELADVTSLRDQASVVQHLRLIAEAQRDAAIRERDEALARAEKAEAREREIGEELDKATGMVEMHVDDAAAARLLWRQSEAACAQMHAERDEALAILRELVRDSADSGCVSVALGRARKLVGGAQ